MAAKYRTNVELIDAVGRMIRTAGRRCADGDVSDLPELLALGDEVNRAITAAVVGLRSHGVYWSSIGEAIGTSKENAVQRWGPRRP